jgi:hypothetical protein
LLIGSLNAGVDFVVDSAVSVQVTMNIGNYHQHIGAEGVIDLLEPAVSVGSLERFVALDLLLLLAGIHNVYIMLHFFFAPQPAVIMSILS